MIADRYGGKHTLGCGMLFSILCNVITPFVVRSYGSTGLIILRFFVGLGQVRKLCLLLVFGMLGINN